MASRAQVPESSFQISSPLSAGDAADDARLDADLQISRVGERLSLATQLILDDERDEQLSQIPRAAGDLRSVSPLSRPERHAAPAERIGGTDRCDPARPRPDQTGDCGKTLESRFGDFAASQVDDISPERRLLEDHEITQSSDEIASAARRLGSTGTPSSSLNTLGVASLVLNGQQQQKPRKPDEMPELDESTQAILNFLGVTGPR